MKYPAKIQLSVCALWLGTLTPAVPAESDLAQTQIRRGSDAFELTYRAKLPVITDTARIWVPFARSDRFQKVHIKNISTPTEWQLTEDSTRGNWVLSMILESRHSGGWVEIQYGVQRVEKSAYPAGDEDIAPYLKPERLVPVNDMFRDLAAQVVGNRTSDLAKARALYHHTLDRMRYDKSGEGWGRGDAMYACNAREGNCTDFHAYFIALCRSIQIPARFAIGFTIPAAADNGSIGGYHCWAEFYADEQWVPVDISEADKHPRLTEYYFGHHPANRFELSVGRDLEMNPTPQNGPLNFLVYPFLESAGGPMATENEFTFRRVSH